MGALSHWSHAPMFPCIRSLSRQCLGGLALRPSAFPWLRAWSVSAKPEWRWVCGLDLNQYPGFSPAGFLLETPNDQAVVTESDPIQGIENRLFQIVRIAVRGRCRPFVGASLQREKHADLEGAIERRPPLHRCGGRNRNQLLVFLGRLRRERPTCAFGHHRPEHVDPALGCQEGPLYFGRIGYGPRPRLWLRIKWQTNLKRDGVTGVGHAIRSARFPSRLGSGPPARAMSSRRDVIQPDSKFSRLSERKSCHRARIFP